MTKPDSRDMVLLVLYFYQTLPQLVPRTTLDFAGKLGDKQVSCPPALKIMLYLERSWACCYPKSDTVKDSTLVAFLNLYFYKHVTTGFDSWKWGC